MMGEVSWDPKKKTIVGLLLFNPLYNPLAPPPPKKNPTSVEGKICLAFWEEELMKNSYCMVSVLHKSYLRNFTIFLAVSGP
jgi:hypothetical protein